MCDEMLIDDVTRQGIRFWLTAGVLVKCLVWPTLQIWRLRTECKLFNVPWWSKWT